MTAPRGLVLVTGATGFVGRACVDAFLRAGHRVRRVLRSACPPVDGVEDIVVGDLVDVADWSTAMRGVDAVVHLAARVHVMRETVADPVAEFRRVNVEATRRLAEAAAHAGVRRFVFVSSVKVHGERSPGRPFTEADVPAPEDPYGVSKLEAEQMLAGVAAGTGLEVVVLRPPLVYGPGVGGNLRTLLRAVVRGLPLPLGAVRNRRSLVFVGNLADAIVRCVESPAAAGRTFLVDDGEPRSTAQLVGDLARAAGRAPRLVAVPTIVLRAVARGLGQGAAADRLVDDLEIDSSALRQALAWHPPHAYADGIAATVRWFRAPPGSLPPSPARVEGRR